MRQYLLTRAAYGRAWSLEANRRRLEMSRGITIRSIHAQTTQDFEWLVLLDRRDPLISERRAAFDGARFLYLDTGRVSPKEAAYRAYRGPWASAIGVRDEVVAMTRLDDDDALAPWAMERFAAAAAGVTQRTALVLPRGLRIWQGCYTLVRHRSNAMQTLVTLPGDALTVYDYGHREVRRVAQVRYVDERIGWLWSRHQDTISGWHFADAPVPERYRALFPVDWSLYGQPPQQLPKPMAFGRAFR